MHGDRFAAAAQPIILLANFACLGILMNLTPVFIIHLARRSLMLLCSQMNWCAVERKQSQWVVQLSILSV
jgi:hypothetical protein